MDADEAYWEWEQRQERDRHEEEGRGGSSDCPECGGRGWTEYASGVVAPDGTHEWLKEPCGTCNKNGELV